MYSFIIFIMYFRQALDTATSTRGEMKDVRNRQEGTDPLQRNVANPHAARRSTIGQTGQAKRNHAKMLSTDRDPSNDLAPHSLSSARQNRYQSELQQANLRTVPRAREGTMQNQYPSSDEDELAGRSVHQEIDYQDPKKARGQIQKANAKNIAEQQSRKLSLNLKKMREQQDAESQLMTQRSNR
jgi:hypothetical protein